MRSRLHAMKWLIVIGAIVAGVAVVTACGSAEVSKPAAPQAPAPAAPAVAAQAGTMTKAAEPEDPAAPAPAAPALKAGDAPGPEQVAARAQSLLAVEREIPEADMGPQYGGSYVASGSTAPDSFDPNIGGHFHGSWHYEFLGVGDWAVDRDVFDYIGFYVPPELQVGLIAESWEQPDPGTIIFKIRDGVYWHDKFPANGRLMTAEDVAFSWHRLSGLGSGFTEPGPNFRDYFRVITSIEAVDDTVVFKYEPNISLLGQLLTEGTSDHIVNRDAVEEWGEITSPDRVIGTGAFVLKEYVEGVAITWEKNTNYWGFDENHPENRMPYVDIFKQHIISDFSTQKAAFRSAQVDEIGGVHDRPPVPPREAEVLLKGCPECGFHVRRPEGWGIGMSFDWQEDAGGKPWGDINVRRALQMAIPMEEIANVYYRGFTDPTPYPAFGYLVRGFYTPFEELSDDVKQYFEYDPERARQMMADAGYPDGFDVTLWVSPSQDPDLAQLVKGYFSEIGVNMAIQEMEWGIFISRIFALELDEWMLDYVCPQGEAMARAANFYDPRAKLMYKKWADPEIERLMDIAAETLDYEEHKAALRGVSDRITEQFYRVVFPCFASVPIWQPWVHAFNGEYQIGDGDIGSIYKHVWVDTEMMADRGVRR